MPEPDAELLHHLRTLELELQEPAARGDPERLAALFHEAYLEFGRSGRIYSKRDELARLPGEAGKRTIVADQFALRRLGPDAALLTYRSADRLAGGSLERHALRASLWQRTRLGWQLAFHQGTPTAPFDG